MSEFIGNVEGAKEVSLVWVADVAGVDEQKGLNESHCGIDFAFSFVSRQLQVGCSI
jgi:hypothetical protein